MTLAELQERRNNIAADIRSLGDTFKKNGEQWKGDEEKKWNRLNKEYDEVSAKMSGEKVSARMAEVDHLQTSVPHDPRNIGGGTIRSSLLGNPGVQRQGMKFRDGNGRIVQAYTSGETLMNEQVRQHRPELADVDIGDVIHSMITGRPENIGRDAFNAAIGAVDSDGGFTLEPTLSTRLIDLARDSTVVLRAGGQTLPMSNGEVTLASITGDPTPQWRSEGIETTASAMTFGRLTLRARTLSAVVPVSLELLEDASNIGQIIRNALTAAMAVELDRAALIGDDGGEEPLGIRYNDGINEVASVGTPTNYAEVRQAIGDIYEAKYPGDPSGLAWIAHPRDLETYDALVDTTGQPLMKSPWLANVPQYATTALPTTEGGGSNESIGFVGDFSNVVIGMRTNIRIRVATDGTATDIDSNQYNAGAGLMRHIVAYMRADVAMLRPSWMTLLSGITNS